VVGAQNWSFSTATGVLSLTSKAIITSFGVAGSTGVINQVSKTIALTVPYYPWGTNVNGLATLAPTYTLTSGTCNQTSGSPPSPTFAAANPNTYTVTDGTATNNYSVTVTITPASTNKDILTFGLPGNAGYINGTNITLTVAVGTSLTNLAPTLYGFPVRHRQPGLGQHQQFLQPRHLYRHGPGRVHQALPHNGADLSGLVQFRFLLYPDRRRRSELVVFASETNFPVLLRLNSTFFTFGQAKANGDDIRFSTSAGDSVAYQIEQWDVVNGKAVIWLKVPVIVGNARRN